MRLQSTIRNFRKVHRGENSAPVPNPAELLNGDLALSNRVRVQVPIELLAPHANLIIRSPIWLFTPAGKRYALAHPAGSDLLLAVEVA